MIVKCLSKFGKNLPEDYLVPKSGFGLDCEFNLEINKYYVVYGMTIFKGYIWYFICDESYTYYPFWNPSPLFSVADGKLSKYWIFSFTGGENKEKTRNIWAYPEWANDPSYYNALTDGDEREVKIFRKYKALMDLEFPNPNILDKATILNEEWLLCPFCIDGWKSLSTDGMVVCPTCKKVLHNPRYQNFIKIKLDES